MLIKVFLNKPTYITELLRLKRIKMTLGMLSQNLANKMLHDAGMFGVLLS